MIIYIYTPSPLVHDSNLCVAHRVTDGGSRVELYNIIVGLSALLVSTDRAMREPQDVERVTDGSTFLFCILSSPYRLIKKLAPEGPGCSKKSNKMKTMKRVFSLLLFFVAAMSVQTVQAQTNGDVNGDGKVNEQDITAILEIIAEAGGVKEQTKYYWYVGQENPASMTSISPIVNDNTSPGWRLIGTTVPNYSETNMLWDGVTNNIQVDKESGVRAQYFVAVPNNKIQIYNGLKGSEMSNYETSEITINGVKYYVYSYKSKGRTFMMNLY